MLETINRIDFIDILKFLSAFMIIIYHFSEFGVFDYGYETNSIYYPGLGKTLLGLCSASVPLFFLINGFLTINKKYSLKKILFKVLSIIKVYFIWGFIICFFLNIKNLTFVSILNSFRADLGWFWFLKTLAFLYIFNYIFNHLSNKDFWGKLIIILLLIYPFATNLLWVFLAFFNPNIVIPAWGITGLFTLYSLVYYLSSKYFSKNLNILTCIILIILGLILNYFEVFVYSNIFKRIQDNVNAFFPTYAALFITLGIWNIFRNIKFNFSTTIFGNFICYIGKNALGIYILHIPIILFFRRFITGTLTGLEGILICLLILFLATSISSLIKSIKPLGWLLKI